MFFSLYRTCKNFSLEPAQQIAPNLICPHIRLLINTQVNALGERVEYEIQKQSMAKKGN